MKLACLATGLALAATILTIPAAHAQNAEASPAANAPELYQRAVQPADRSTLYAFDFVDEVKRGTSTYVKGRVDPSRPAGDRVKLLEVKGVDAAKADEKYERLHTEDPTLDLWCDTLGSRISGPVTEKGAKADGRAFAVKPVARQFAPDNEKQLYKQLTAEVVIDEAKSVMTSFSARLAKPWKPNVFAKVTAADFSGECQLAPNGRAYASRTHMELSGSAVTGSLDETRNRQVMNLTPVS